MKGLVVRSTGLWYEVNHEGKRLKARLCGKKRLEDMKLTNPIAVGDRVEIESSSKVDNEWIITAIEARRNYLIRKSPRKKGYDHLMATNIDQGLLIATLKQPRTSTGFINRFLISLEAFRIPGVIVFNKKDLYNNRDIKTYERLRMAYELAGYQVLLESFIQDVSQLQSLLKNKRTLILGHSGAGKSTLVNALLPEVNQEVRPISKFANKGVHTTTYAELFHIDASSSIIDTPGIKELGLAEIAAVELGHFFPEIRNQMSQCKFHNCLHTNEPGCVVRGSVGKQISKDRYADYLSILQESDNRR